MFVFCATGFKNFTIGFSLRLRTSFECKYVLCVERERKKEKERERKKERKKERKSEGSLRKKWKKNFCPLWK